MKTIRFGIIGGGLMGREFGSAAARWPHLTGELARPEIIGVCDPNPAALDWFRRLGTVRYFTGDYQELLQRDDIDAIYCAVPHNLHAQIYCDVIRAGKHLMGEKPFGIDLAANQKILEAAAAHPNMLVRCAGENPFFPACQELIGWIKQQKFGRIVEFRSGFNHSSDLDLKKPVNWKRMVKFNGEYGCMGDLGMHIQHIPFRMGFLPQNVYASLSNLVTERPDGKGGMAVCDTWDNAMLLCDAVNREGDCFPLYLETKRMMPGATNEWYVEVYGIKGAAKYSTSDPNAFCYTQAWGKEQAWCRIDIGCKPQFPTITGSIFQFGFTDSILQMWAAFAAELEGKQVAFGCVTPEETRLSHLLMTGALESNRRKRAVNLADDCIRKEDAL